MANSINDALNRASTDQRERALKTIEEARRTIQSYNMQMGDISSVDASSVSRQAQIIEEAKRTIPSETMKDVATVSPPLNTPNVSGRYNSNVIELHPDMRADIESVEQSGGNNYLNDNAVDRALACQARETPQYEEPQRAMGR